MNLPLPHTALDAPIASFLAHQRALGRDYQTEEHVLRGVRTFVVQQGATDLEPPIFERWCGHLRPLARIIHERC